MSTMVISGGKYPKGEANVLNFLFCGWAAWLSGTGSVRLQLGSAVRQRAELLQPLQLGCFTLTYLLAYSVALCIVGAARQ